MSGNVNRFFGQSYLHFKILVVKMLQFAILDLETFPGYRVVEWRKLLSAIPQSLARNTGRLSPLREQTPCLH